MEKTFVQIIAALIMLIAASCSKQFDAETDILVVGGGTSGVTAGIQSARMGAKALILEETPWLGGMLTAAGVSAVDGNYNLPAGLWGEFRSRLAAHYGGIDSLKTGWVSNVLFEPKVGNEIFKDMVSAEKNLTVWHSTKLLTLRRDGDCWIATVATDGEDNRVIKARLVIDATELGDVAKMCGVKYDIGMESRADTHEDVAPEHSNGIVQDLTYVAVLKDYGTDVTIPEPEGYAPATFACCCQNERCVNPKEPDRVWSPDMMIGYGRLPGGKYMINWPIEGNDYYVNIIEMTPDERVKALEEAKAHTMRFIYFIQKELGYNTLGLADDEFPTADRLPMIPYHRESRRIHGVVRFGLNHITNPYEQSQKLYRTSIAVGDYPVDHHHTRYTGDEELPNLYFHPVPSFGVPLGVMIPQEVDGLIVAEKSISVSNIVNGTTRLQPVVMQIGQAAGALAALALKDSCEVRNVPVRDVQDAVLNAGGYLQPYLDVTVNDPRFKAFQRIGSTGILRAEGRNVGWSNQTWLRADEKLIGADLEGLAEFYPECLNSNDYKKAVKRSDSPVTLETAAMIIASIAGKGTSEVVNESLKAFRELGEEDTNDGSVMTRGHWAILVDRILDPFHNTPISLTGTLPQ